ncbi:JmjC domain-containing protein [Nonomuraea sp. NPDC003560]|uniref:JmjC domain-containing protein n=1 Tax=Nonomuraea sp. NPDC003560 TaxID=3364341 RepID=UPI0036CB671D
MAETLTRPLTERAVAGGREPLIIRRAALDWPLARTVRDGGLLARFGDQEVGATRTGERRTMTLAEALALNSDEFDPWYLCWNVHGRRDELVGELPEAFASWFDWLPEPVRPAWTWIFVGPSGTGTPLHLDTMGSSAWNALLSGAKEWRVMSPRRSVRAGLLSQAVAETLPDVGDVEYTCTQHPGDLLFVPGGWAHEVMNTGDTVSITGNFVNASNIGTVEAALTRSGDDTWREITRRVRQAATRLREEQG